jgi:hypothetical protein
MSNPTNSPLNSLRRHPPTMPGALDSLDKEPRNRSHEGTEGDFQDPSSTPTPYMAKSIQANEAPVWDNFRAAIFSWLTLAGYVVFPGTFTSLRNSQSLANNNSGKIIQDAVKNLPLLPIAILCCIIGTTGTSWLWWIWRNNAVWLVTHIFL